MQNIKLRELGNRARELQTTRNFNIEHLMLRVLAGDWLKTRAVFLGLRFDHLLGESEEARRRMKWLRRGVLAYDEMPEHDLVQIAQTLWADAPYVSAKAVQELVRFAAGEMLLLSEEAIDQLETVL